MASSTQWTSVWTNSVRWPRTGKPGVLQSMQLQRVRHNWATKQQQASINTPGRIETVSQDLVKGLADMIEGKTSGGEVCVSIQKNGTQYASKVKWSPLTLYNGIPTEFQQVSLNPSPKLGLSTIGGCPTLSRAWTQPSTTPLISTELWSIKVTKVLSWASLVSQTVKSQPSEQETQVWPLGWEDPLEKGMATHSNILAWRIPWTEKSGSLQSMGLQRVRHNWVTNTDFSHSPLKALSYLPLWSHVCTGELDCTIPDHPGSLWIWPITPACQGSFWILTPFIKVCIALSPLHVSLNLSMHSASLFQPQTLHCDKTENEALLQADRDFTSFESPHFRIPSLATRESTNTLSDSVVTQTTHGSKTLVPRTETPAGLYRSGQKPKDTKA